MDKDAISSLFYNLTSVAETHGFAAIPNDKTTLTNVVKDLMPILKTKNLHDKYMIRRGIMTAVATRSDFESVHPNAVHIFPQLEATTNIFSDDSSDEAMDYAGESWSEVSTSSRVRGDEQLLDYFREDDMLHVFHSAWHSDNNRQRHRMRERFWYMHSQMLNRYQIERRVAGMSALRPLNSRSGTFPSSYNARSGNIRSLRQFVSNRRTCRFSRRTINQMNREISMLAPNRNRGRSIERFAGEVEEGFHVIGHNAIGAGCVTGRGVGVMNDPRASGRDPLFWRWHWEVENKFSSFLGTLRPHSRRAVIPPTGVRVEDVNITSCNKNNVVQTYWERYRGNRYRLNHQSCSNCVKLTLTWRDTPLPGCRLLMWPPDPWVRGSALLQAWLTVPSTLTRRPTAHTALLEMASPWKETSGRRSTLPASTSLTTY